MLVGLLSGAIIAELGKIRMSFIRVSEIRVVFRTIASLAGKLRQLSRRLRSRKKGVILLRRGRRLAQNVRLNTRRARNRFRSVCTSLMVCRAIAKLV
jgi:hypothetical protein